MDEWRTQSRAYLLRTDRNLMIKFRASPKYFYIRDRDEPDETRIQAYVRLALCIRNAPVPLSCVVFKPYTRTQVESWTLGTWFFNTAITGASLSLKHIRSLMSEDRPYLGSIDVSGVPVLYVQALSHRNCDKGLVMLPANLRIFIRDIIGDTVIMRAVYVEEVD